jgi:hypothetical protein
MTVLIGANTSASRRRRGKRIGSLLLLCAGAIGLAACSGGSGGATSGQGTTTSVVHNTLVTPPKGESAVKVPSHITYGTGSIGAADPTTTLPSELGQAIQPGLNPGQNIIIKGGRVLPQTLESAPQVAIVWYNLSGKPQRIVFDGAKPLVDSGTIPPGGTFTWTPPAGGPINYTLEPSGFSAKVFVNPPD